MTFHKYAAFFEPDELAALTAAYDAAWQQLVGQEAHPHFRAGSCPEKESVADDFGVRLQREARRRAIERDCIARRRL